MNTQQQSQPIDRFKLSVWVVILIGLAIFWGGIAALVLAVFS